MEGVEVVFPRVKRIKRTEHGKKTVIEPLFPGYLFASFAPNELSGPVNHTRGVLHLVRRDSKPVAVEHGVITELRALGPEAVLSLELAALMVGDKVRIVRGVFAGAEGGPGVAQAQAAEEPQNDGLAVGGGQGGEGLVEVGEQVVGAAGVVAWCQASIERWVVFHFFFGVAAFT